jgi:hypothetical protein
MAFQEQYLRSKERFLNDKLICEKNRKLFKEFFEYEEYKLKRMNGLDKLDEATYNTLGGYVQKLGNVNKWFKNKPWKELTKEDIKKVYDALEDGKIKNKMGQKIGDLKGYYGKIFKSKPFELAGKTEIVNEVMEFYKRNDKQEVRFIEQETFKKIASVVIKPEHKFLIWLSFDIGENINTLIQLKKADFFRQVNPNTKEAEYVFNLPKDKLKRTRQTRSEITNFKETVEFADIILQNLKDDELPFKFGYRQAKKFLDRAVKITNAKCIPKGQPVTWKDLRSSMACYLLKSSWSLDEVNARLGHKPSSREIDKYINFLAIKRHDTKKKLYDNDVRRLADEIEERKKMESLQTGRIKNQQDEIEYLKIKMDELLEGQKETVNGMHRLRADMKKSKQ